MDTNSGDKLMREKYIQMERERIYWRREPHKGMKGIKDRNEKSWLRKWSIGMEVTYLETVKECQQT